MGARKATATAPDDHRMFDGRQCPRGASGCGDGAAMQSVPAHEADYAVEHSGEPAVLARGSRGRSGGRRKGAEIGREDYKSKKLARRPGKPTRLSSKTKGEGGSRHP